jgi:hypothetical protein
MRADRAELQNKGRSHGEANAKRTGAIACLPSTLIAPGKGAV